MSQTAVVEQPARAGKVPVPASLHEKYSWAGGLSPPVTANRFANYVRELAKKLGRAVEARDLVDDARDNQKHPLHGYFTWNDAEAGELHRVDQAGTLLRQLRVQIIAPDERIFVIRALFSVRDDESNRRGYVFSIVALKVPDLRQQLLQQAARELRAYCGKYSALLAVTGTENAAQKLVARLERLLLTTEQ